MRKISLILLTFFALPVLADVTWHNEAELGSTIVSGNTQTATYNGAEKAAVKINDDLLKLSGRYLQSTANGLESAKNWATEARYERILSAVFSVYASYGLESDIYSGYVQRNNYDLGGKYYFSDSVDTKWEAELGYKNSFTQFVTPAPDAQASFIRVYSEINQNFTPGSSGKFWFEYLPNIINPNNYRFNFEPSVTMILNQIFSLKVADRFEYQNQLPPNFHKYMDSFFTLSLVSKF